MKGSYIWDNTYLIGSFARSRDKLSATFAVEALKILEENGDDLTAASFIEKVCKPMRLVEVWCTLMCKRYGSVASQSAALVRVVGRLTSWGGLADVRRCIDAGVVFQDPAAGISECSLLVAEFDKCKAGGLPPPARIRIVAELKAEREQTKLRFAEAAKEAAEKEQAEKAAAEDETRAAEADMLLLTSKPSAEKLESIEGRSSGYEEIAAEVVNKRLENVRFINTPDGLTGAHLGQID